MKRAAPTIAELLALEAVARHRNLVDAAHELCVTASAVSRRVSGLEAFLGAPLFHRVGKRFALTHAGRSYLARVQPALRTLETASLEVLASRDGGGTLALASVPTFTTKCLIPLLGAFGLDHPGVTLNFRQHLAGNDPMPHDVDAAIRFGEGSWPGVTSEYLSGREFIVVCAERVLKRQPRLRQARGLASATLLQHQAVPSAWAQWCSARGVRGVNAHAGPRFEQYASLVGAVIAEMGVGLAPRCLVQDELRRGEIVEPFASEVSLPYGHFLCYAPDRADSPVFQAFRMWLHGACGEAGRSAPGGSAGQ